MICKNNGVISQWGPQLLRVGYAGGLMYVTYLVAWANTSSYYFRSQFYIFYILQRYI